MANVLTVGGRELIVGRIMAVGSGIGTAEAKYIAWGTGAGTSGTADTTLFGEASETRVTGTSSKQTGTSTNNTYQVVGTLTANGTKTITNAGLFDSASSGAGTMFVKGDFTGIALNLSDSIQLTFQVAFT